MKQALELVDKAKIRDKNTQESDAINSLMKIIKGQGQKDLSNYQALTKGLQESDKERLELSMLNRLLEQSLKQDESLKVFDSAQFFNKLNEFKDDVFTTPKAKEYIDIASGFHKLFKNDAKIALSLKPATTKNLSQGLATTLSGALKYQWTKFTLGTLYRNAPDRILGVKLPKALNEATIGAASDAIITNLALDKENKADEIIRHALSEGALSLATDTIMLGAGKVLKPLAKAPLKLAEMSMPFQFTKNFFTGNTKRASEIIENTLSKEQQEALKEFSAQFGGETKINQESGKDFLRDKIKSVFKGDENKLKAYDKVKEILTLDNHKEQQQAFIRAIRSDETGNTLAFLIEAANLSPKANANLKSILNQTTENLTKSLKQFDLKDYEIKSVFDNLEQGTKESYDKALNEIIGKLYDNSYKVNLRESVQDATNFQKFLNDLKAQGEIDPQAKSFLRQIEENVYNPNGVTYEQLKNSRQLINAYLRNVKDPSTLGYIQKASANFLKNDIDNAIESLLKQNKSAYEKISELQKKCD